VHALAHVLRVPEIVVECVADEATIRQRLETRTARPDEAAAGQPALSDAGFDVYLAQRAHAEPPGKGEPTLRIDTAGERTQVVDGALAALWAWRRGHAARVPLKLGA
jgi:predicted kinase